MTTANVFTRKVAQKSLLRVSLFLNMEIFSDRRIIH